MTLVSAVYDDTVCEVEAVDAVIAAGRAASRRHWVPATSGNFSVRIDRDRIAITKSGVDKGDLRRTDVLIQDITTSLRPGSSAEAALHVRLYRDRPQIGAVFHAHGVASAVIGRAHAADRALRLHGWELQKALSGVTTHDVTVEVPIFDNDQDIATLGSLNAWRPRRNRELSVRPVIFWQVTGSTSGAARLMKPPAT